MLALFRASAGGHDEPARSSRCCRWPRIRYSQAMWMVAASTWADYQPKEDEDMVAYENYVSPGLLRDHGRPTAGLATDYGEADGPARRISARSRRRTGPAFISEKKKSRWDACVRFEGGCVICRWKSLASSLRMARRPIPRNHNGNSCTAPIRSGTVEPSTLCRANRRRILWSDAMLSRDRSAEAGCEPANLPSDQDASKAYRRIDCYGPAGSGAIGGVRYARDAAGSHWLVWRDGVHGGAPDARDRDPHGIGRGPATRAWLGDAGSAGAGRSWGIAIAIVTSYALGGVIESQAARSERPRSTGDRFVQPADWRWSRLFAGYLPALPATRAGSIVGLGLGAQRAGGLGGKPRP